MSNDPIYDGLVRRRRFLIITSLALAAAGSLGLTMAEVNILGNRAVVGHPERIVLVGYAVWFWALWTYIQWFNDYHTWTKTRAAIVDARDAFLRRAMRGTKAPPDLLTPFEQKLRKDVDAIWKQEGDTRSTDLDMRVTPTSIEKGRHGGFECVCDLSAFAPHNPAGEKSWGTAGHFRVPVSRGLVWRKTIRAAFHIFATTRFFSEYFAPFFFAALPLVALFWQPRVSESGGSGCSPCF